MNCKLIITVGTLIFTCLFTGCQRKGQGDLLLPVYESSPGEEIPGQSGDALKEGALEEAAGESEGTNPVRESAPNAGAGAHQAKEQESFSVKEEEELVVQICGAVSRPGVYQVEAGSRIYQAVEMAGGFCQDAAQDYLNQADVLADGMKVYVPTNEEVKALGVENNWKDSGSVQKGSSGAEGQEPLPVNINTAGEELLCTLPGVGQSKAKSIMAYREKNGPYQKIEDIMNVEGIKDGLFNKIKDSITVQ